MDLRLSTYVLSTLPTDEPGLLSRPSRRDAELFQIQSDVTCVCTGSDNLFLGTSDGTVRILSSSFTTARSFAAYESSGSITHMRQLPSTSYLITIAEDLSNDPILKVWALDKTEKKTSGPRCLSTVSVQNGRRQFPVGVLGLPSAVGGTLTDGSCFLLTFLGLRACGSR